MVVTIAGVVPASAATLSVGPNEQYKMPSEAVRDVRVGDTVQIAEGTYFDCAVWSTDKLTIVGLGTGAVLSDKTCQGKAIFVVHANDITIRNITFTRARVPDENGAGIRAEGINLTLENTKFIDNQNGILAGDNPTSTITIRDSEFIRNGYCPHGSGCAHGIYINHLALLHVEHSRFYNTLVAHHIKSRAARTELIGNHIEDGPNGTASYEVDLPNGGALVMIGNVIEKGPNNQNYTTSIMIGEEGVDQPTSELTIKNNTFTNDGHATTFVKNITATPARLTGNILKGHPTIPLVGDGTVK
jgi:hypothetical protein